MPPVLTLHAGVGQTPHLGHHLRPVALAESAFGPVNPTPKHYWAVQTSPRTVLVRDDRSRQAFEVFERAELETRLGLHDTAVQRIDIEPRWVADVNELDAVCVL